MFTDAAAGSQAVLPFLHKATEAVYKYRGAREDPSTEELLAVVDARCWRKTSLNIHYSVACVKVYLTVFKRNRTKFAGKYDKSKHTWTYSNVNDMRRNLFKKQMSLENELGGQQLARAVLRMSTFRCIDTRKRRNEAEGAYSEVRLGGNGGRRDNSDDREEYVDSVRAPHKAREGRE